MRRTAMRHLLAGIFIAAFFFAAVPTLHAAPPLSTFTTEQSAQQHCPADAVVWLNLPSGIYHFKGQRWYGRTKSGAFVCKKEADAAGDRGSFNGQ